MEFLGLAWEKSQAAPHLAARPAAISAPGAHDVARLIHTRAAGRWQRYEKHLEPFITALSPAANAADT